LGCDPDDAADLRVPRPRPDRPGAREPAPEPLSRPVWWLAAQQRASELTAGEEGQRLVGLLIAHVETAWPWIEELEALCQGRRERMDSDDEQAHFLRYLKCDVIDLFRSLAEDAANMVPGPDGPWKHEPEPDVFRDRGERFNRYLVVLRLAAAGPGIPDERVRSALRRIGRDLADWYPEFSVIAGAVVCPAPSHQTDGMGGDGAGRCHRA
jgi:hypothetical protein